MDRIGLDWIVAIDPPRSAWLGSSMEHGARSTFGIKSISDSSVQQMVSERTPLRSCRHYHRYHHYGPRSCVVCCMLFAVCRVAFSAAFYCSTLSSEMTLT